ncbi:endomembrane protein [Tritrichomonas foetus]|uniref:Transmembrane 9 superfamily member n=1 Tax=Tritrichomonas foetus TaxID=1144522 RepID=A0A1J4JHR2_9EUKA|nr:endomembrane protein [Tritrichomonas foetus]|eukprot:OHS98698.1 endomembrane protein [Tritrichomonas foetus]
MSPFELSHKVNLLPRQIPPHSFMYDNVVLCTVAGTFSAIMMLPTFHLMLQATWKGIQPFETLLTLLFSFFCMIIISVNSSIFVVFLKLSKEDFRWWWTSALSGAFTGVIFFLYSMVYCLVEYHPIDTSSNFVFLLSNIPVSLAIALINGSISFLGSFFFVQHIYNSLKME